MRQDFAPNEYLAQRTRLVIPDALFSVNIGDTTASLAIELELSLKSKKRYQEIVYKYQRAQIRKGLYVVLSPGLGKSLAKRWQEAHVFGRFRWTLLSEMLTDPLSAVTRDGTNEEPLKEWLMG